MASPSAAPTPRRSTRSTRPATAFGATSATRLRWRSARSTPCAPGRYLRRLRPLRSQAHRFGGSHAQRDLIDLTLIESAARDGQQLLADALRSERARRLA